MTGTTRLALLCAAWALAGASAWAQPAPPADFVDGIAVNFEAGSWDGRLRFPDLYCVGFPEAEHIVGRTSALLNGRAVSMLKVDYDTPIAAYVVTSTMPDTLTIEQERADQLALARKNAELLPELYRFSETSSAMGPQLVKQFTNVAQFGKDNALFPLEIFFHDAPDRILAVAETRLFARKPDRFEVAVIAAVPEGATQADAERLRERVGAMARELDDSLQSCTATMPPRSP